MKKNLIAIFVIIASAISMINLGLNQADALPEVLASQGTFSYENFDQKKYDSLRGKKPFALFFHSSSCGSCAEKDKKIKENIGNLPQNFTLFKVEFERSPTALRKELGVTTYDTFVVFDVSGDFKKFIGGKLNHLTI